jgi:tRNA-splicing ligase RtcB (3'-phosphate/5'-hydroxy nucleic acid ligase)
MSNKQRGYEVLQGERGVAVKAWVKGVQFEDEARAQLLRVAQLPCVRRWVAVMPDVHHGKGATVGSVIPTLRAIIPAAVGVDLGCGMIAVRTSLSASDLPDNLAGLRSAIERAIPHGRTNQGRPGDRGAWSNPPAAVDAAWSELAPGYEQILAKAPRIGRGVAVEHLGTLGTGNHFVELCLDGEQRVWLMLHSGSRGVGNRIGSHYIELARREMERWMIQLPDADLAYLPEGSEHFADYVRAVKWAQAFAATSRRLMLEAGLAALRATGELPPFTATDEAVNCHHNYIARETHYGEELWITRKGAVRAGAGELGIIPGSMGARSYIVRGKGHPESFCSSSHGAGRAMSRGEARRRFTVEDHAAATAGIECRKDAEVIDETPAAYKSIEAVMAAQADLVDVVHELRQVLCVKG